YDLARDIFQFFEERGIGGFTIEGVMDTAAVRSLLSALVYTPDRRFDRLDAAVKSARLPFRLNKPLGSGKKSQSEVTLGLAATPSSPIRSSSCSTARSSPSRRSPP